MHSTQIEKNIPKNFHSECKRKFPKLKKNSITVSPRNYFSQQIAWTVKAKISKYFAHKS